MSQQTVEFKRSIVQPIYCLSQTRVLTRQATARHLTASYSRGPGPGFTARKFMFGSPVNHPLTAQKKKKEKEEEEEVEEEKEDEEEEEE